MFCWHRCHVTRHKRKPFSKQNAPHSSACIIKHFCVASLFPNNKIPVLFSSRAPQLTRLWSWHKNKSLVDKGDPHMNIWYAVLTTATEGDEYNAFLFERQILTELKNTVAYFTALNYQTLRMSSDLFLTVHVFWQ